MSDPRYPSPFYRVALKALIRNGQDQILVVQAADTGLWELPGGGWEFDESMEVCLQREFQEELGVNMQLTNDTIICGYRGLNVRNYMSYKMVVSGSIDSHDFVFDPTDVSAAQFVDEQALLDLNMAPDEAGIKHFIDRIWP